MAAYRRVYDYITCRLTAKNRDQLRNLALGSRLACMSHPSRAFQFVIRFDSLCESIRCVKKSAVRFTSCHAVFLVQGLFIVQSQSKNTPQGTQLKAILYTTSTKTVTQCIMHTLKITPNLLLNISVEAANLSDCRIESKKKSIQWRESNENFFWPELECCSQQWQLLL